MNYANPEHGDRLSQFKYRHDKIKIVLHLRKKYSNNSNEMIFTAL